MPTDGLQGNISFFMHLTKTGEGEREKKKKKELYTQEYSQFKRTFPATEAIWKSKASSAHIWAWVTFSA